MTNDQRAPLAAFFALTVLVMLVLAHGMTRPGVTSFLAEGGAEPGAQPPTFTVPLPGNNSSGSGSVVIVESVDAQGELTYRVDYRSPAATPASPQPSATSAPRIRVTTGSGISPGLSWYLPGTGGSSDPSSPNSPAPAPTVGQGADGSTTATDSLTVKSGIGQDVHTSVEEGGSGKGDSSGVVVPMLTPEDLDPFESTGPIDSTSAPQFPQPAVLDVPRVEDGVVSPESRDGEIDETAPASALAP